MTLASVNRNSAATILVPALMGKRSQTLRVTLLGVAPPHLMASVVAEPKFTPCDVPACTYASAPTASAVVKRFVTSGTPKLETCGPSCFNTSVVCGAIVGPSVKSYTHRDTRSRATVQPFGTATV